MSYKKITELTESSTIADTDYFIVETTNETKKVLATKFKSYIPVRRKLGQTVISSVPITSNSLHLFDGTVLTATNYPDFITFVETLYNTDSSAPFFTDEATWQSTNATYGVCGKFVFDANNRTVRIPKINCIVKGTYVSASLGDVSQYNYNSGSSAITTISQLTYIVVKEEES